MAGNRPVWPNTGFADNRSVGVERIWHQRVQLFFADIIIYNIINIIFLILQPNLPNPLKITGSKFVSKPLVSLVLQ